MDPPSENPNVPARNAVRQLQPPPPPVVLPIVLTNLYIEPSSRRPIALTNLYPYRARKPARGQAPHPPALVRIRTPGQAHNPDQARTPPHPRTPARARTPDQAHNPDQALNLDRGRSPARADTSPRRHPLFSSSPLSSPECTPEPEQPVEQHEQPIKRPPNTSITHVKSIFARLYPELGTEQQSAKYAQFRGRIDQLASTHLDSSVALSHQDEECLKIVNDQLVKQFPWLARCPKNWPVAVCLQSKLHNSAARNVEKNNRKLLTGIKGLGKS